MTSKLDKKQRIMMGIIGAIALLAGFYVLYYEPSQKKIVEIRNSIEAKNNEIRNAKTHAAVFKPLKEQVAMLEGQLAHLKAKLATSGEIISLVKTIEDEAKRLDLKVINMYSTVHEPPPPAEKTETEEAEGSQKDPAFTFTKTVLDISLQGNYNKLEAFMDTIQHLETFLVVEELDISSGEKRYPRLTSNLKINLYNEKGADNNAIAK
jgi:Tfp pilus assembly protein PilO